MLRQAWDAPGSPFAGQPFNPSAVNWSGGGGGGGQNMSFPSSRASSSPDYHSMIAAAQGPDERARLQAMQAKRLSRVESISSGQSADAKTE